MKAVICTYNNNRNIMEDIKNIRILLNETFKNNDVDQIDFYKRLYGTNTIVARVTFTHPFEVSIYPTRLTVKEQKEFLNFIKDNLNDNIYGAHFNLICLE